MLPKQLPQRRALTLLLLPMLCAACGHNSPRSEPVPGPAIPPLPAQARQTDSPTFSINAQRDIRRWQQLLTEPSSPARPASAASNP